MARQMACPLSRFPCTGGGTSPACRPAWSASPSREAGVPAPVWSCISRAWFRASHSTLPALQGPLHRPGNPAPGYLTGALVGFLVSPAGHPSRSLEIRGTTCARSSPHAAPLLPGPGHHHPDQPSACTSGGDYLITPGTPGQSGDPGHQRPCSSKPPPGIGRLSLTPVRPGHTLIVSPSVAATRPGHSLP